YAKQKLLQDYHHALKMKDQAEKERSQAFFILQKKNVALQEKDVALQERDAALQEKDTALQEKNQEIIRLKQMLESKLDGTTS
ncbi:hypothetical protein MHK_005552, partial [Candidatus Magnetomorum sp. HK-1]